MKNSKNLKKWQKKVRGFLSQLILAIFKNSQKNYTRNLISNCGNKT